MCLDRRTAVLQREGDERLRQGVRAAVSHEAVAHRRERLSVKRYLGVSLACVAVVVDIIGNVAVNRFAGVVEIRELYGTQVVGECLFGYVAGEQCGAVAVWERQFCSLRLARDICDVSRNEEIEVSLYRLIVLFGHYYRHIHRERSVARGL